MRRLLIPVLATALALAGCGGSSGGAKRSAQTTSGNGSRPAAPKAQPARKVSGPHDRPVPILMYHVIAAPRPGAPNQELYTPAPVFGQQMHALAGRGYHAVTLGQVYRYWRQGYALPSKPIVISFDDGYLSHFTNARPVLRSLGWPGVLNLEVNNIRAGDLTRSEVRALIAAGWEIDSHTITHPDLTTLAPAALRRELVGSRRRLQREFGQPVDFFCYPSGRFDATVVAAVRAAGYKLATTVQPALASPKQPYTLGRIRVDGQDGVSGLIAKLAAPGTAQNGSGGA